MPHDSTPRILPTLILNGFAPGSLGITQPGIANGTLLPTSKFVAPQTICRSPEPSFTLQSESRSASGCGSFDTTSATTMPSKPPDTFSTPSTSRPIIVSRSASSSGDQSKSTYRFSQL